jgi:hypothetical protein
MTNYDRNLRSYLKLAAGVTVGMLLCTVHASLSVYFDYTVAYNRKILVALSPGRK